MTTYVEDDFETFSDGGWTNGTTHGNWIARTANTGIDAPIPPVILEFSEDFEGASPLNNFDAKSTGGSPAGRLEVKAGAAKNGSLGLEMTPNSSTSFVKVREQLWQGGTTSAYPFWSVRFYWRLPTFPSSGNKPSVMSVITDSSVDDFTMFWDLGTANALKYDLDQGDYARTDVLAANTWYLIEVRGSFADALRWAEFRLDGELQDRIETPGSSAEEVNQIVWGPQVSNQIFTQHIDDILIKVSDQELDFLGIGDL